jgi:hypothetical protein
MSVRMEQIGPHSMDFHEILYLKIFRKSAEKIQVLLNVTRVTSTLHEDLCIFMTLSV